MATSSSRGGVVVGGSDDDDEPYLLGFIVANIVGMRHYAGKITGRENVGLVRQPLNLYDENAIMVVNGRGDQVGHIDRATAAALAPLLDSHLLAAAHAIVPKPTSKAVHRLPCQIHLFARPAAVAAIDAAIRDAGIDLIHADHPEFSLSQSAAVMERTKKADRDVDKLFSLVGKEGKSRIEPMEAPGDVVLSELFQHQKEALGWLVHREESSDLPPFWGKNEDGGFENVLTNQKTKQRPPPLKGGIFADDMGLGKTLTLLALIGRGKACNVGAKKAKGAKRRKVEGSGEGPQTTLVVCPKSVFSAWVIQLEEHIKAGSLKVYMYHGERTRDKKELLKYDLVLTTYSTLGTEFEQDSPLKDINWFRVILDEAHVIKNSAARQTKAVIALNTERRWVVTGTPIQNSSFDLYPLMAFLRFQPFSIKSYWQSLIQRPLEKGNKTGLSRLQNLLGAISLRRTKETETGSKSMVDIPPKTVLVCYIDLSAEEREYYDQMELEGKNKMQEFGDRDSILRNYSTVLYFILRLRQLCNDVALCPLDMKSWLPANSLEDVSKNPELLKKLASLVDDGDDFDCPICLSPPTKTVITSCTHIYCQTCILKILKSSSSRCPICRRSLSKEDIFLAPEVKHPDDDGSGNLGSDRPLSSKMQALLKLLKASQNQDPLSKSVVFSQFRKMLILLEEPLKKAGFKILRLDGSMTAKKRLQVIQQFAHVGPDAPTVLLASLKAAGAGVNLTAASTVYLFDPWWNPGVEEQAMDRVHRIGQKKEVKVVRLIVKGSIEERILSLQEGKKRLITNAFGKKRDKDDKEMRVEELRMMMGL
ncbi:putative SWI/SNF-related matrix-associated actin-dependent regulator of chromatin subfamily A member 3-like 1 [Phragmites australis]|uniref:putative SWI/SNF-related matrix-associated actin-dependent regulator of chromatin subfamily A member 3-like 1 n=1 Tax=Phragmites australis TaxID=29695 RepID=UPI002D7987E7|nr:putative SWI/SNF-related matrix-associated actin-dependent regulator of chromatin subfamily A member 3-like 1 [Phragmites australis]